MYFSCVNTEILQLHLYVSCHDLDFLTHILGIGVEGMFEQAVLPTIHPRKFISGKAASGTKCSIWTAHCLPQTLFDTLFVRSSALLLESAHLVLIAPFIFYYFYTELLVYVYVVHVHVGSHMTVKNHSWELGPQ